MSDAARKAAFVIGVMKHIPGAIDVVAEQARKIKGIRDEFREKHWGDEPDGVTSRIVVPNIDSGLVELGELVGIDYVASKGRKTFTWEHEFDKPYPTLAFAADGSGLVIVRGRSRYTVTKRGIEG